MRNSKNLDFFAVLSFLACLLFYTGLSYGQEASSVSSISKIPDEVHARAAQAVVKITAGEKDLGAGVVIGKTRNGLPVILTANALISGHEDQITIQPAEQAQSVAGRLITEKWRNRELVLLAARQALPVAAGLPYGRSDQLPPGEPAAVLGFPQSNFLGQNSGQIVRNEVNQIMLNFVMAAGQIGGPVLDKNGYVIGIAISRPGELGQAVPIDMVQAALAQWLGNTHLVESWQEGKTTTSWQGWLIAAGLLIATGVAVAVSGVF